MTGPMRKTGGFSMLPLIIMLFLVVGLISAGILMLGPKAAGQRMADTTASLNSMAGAIISWSAATRVLPATLTPVFTSIPSDSWGNSVLYIFDNRLRDTTTGGICGRTTTGLSVIVNGATTPNVAFVLLSSGGNDTPHSTWTETPVLSRTVTAYGSGATGATATLVSGDLFKIVTLDELKNRAGCYSTTGGRLKILNNELPSVCAGSASYPATLFGEGGVPGYTWAKVSGSPAWITLNTAGVLAPAGTITTSAGTYKLTVSLTDNHTPLANTVQKTFNLKVVSCGVPPINFNDLANDFSKVDGSGNNIIIDPGAHTVNMGNNQYNGTNGYGCLWFKTNQTLAGMTLRSYFNFRTNSDYSPASTTYGDGFTLTVMQGANPTTVCGGAGEVLGYGARDGHSIPGDSFAIEFDTYPNGNENDPVNYNHVVVVKGGNVLHNGGGSVSMGVNPGCTGASHPGCYYRNPISWMEDGALHSARIEVATQCNSTCSACGPTSPSGSYSLVRAWIDCGYASCSSLTADYTAESPTLTHCMPLPASMNNVKIGFTEATWGATQSTIISNFFAGFY